MDHAISSIVLPINKRTESCGSKGTSLLKAQVNREYIIKEVKTNDEELKNFLFTLGCYEGEKVTVASVLSETFAIIVKDARYSIDKHLAEAIII